MVFIFILGGSAVCFDNETDYEPYAKINYTFPGYIYSFALDAGDYLRVTLYMEAYDLDFYLYREGMNLLSTSSFVTIAFSVSNP